MVKRGARVLMAAFFGLLGVSGWAGIVAYEEGDKKLEVGGRIQIEYVLVDPDCATGVDCILDTSLETGDATLDELNFRRLRPYLKGTITKNWAGKIEFDFGESVDSDEIQVKDAYMEYTGFGKEHLTLTVGNAKPPFSREFITSSAKLQMVERSFVGDHNFGSPDRVLGAKIEGLAASGKLGWGASLGVGSHDPDSNRLDFDTPVNSQNDWNDGMLVAGRVDIQPLGPVAFEQADFGRSDFRVAVGLATFYWENDDDNNTYIDPATGATIPQDPAGVVKTDLAEADGYEISLALRARGFAVDLARHFVSAETVDPAFTGGLYLDGASDLDLTAITAGYMVVQNRLEVTASWDSLDADNYQDRFERTTFGVNYYWNKHNLKFQANYRLTENFLGRSGQDQNLVLGMMTYVF
jgi:hypothetical protein